MSLPTAAITELHDITLAAAVVVLFVALVGVILVTQRWRRATRKFDERAAALSALSAESMIVLNEDQEVEWISDAATELLGVARDDMLGRAIDQLEDRAVHELLSRVDLAASRDSGDDLVVDRPGRDGSVRHLQIGGSELRAADGAYVGAAIWLRDVTAPRRAEARLRESEDRYRRLVEAAQEVIWTCDTDLVMTFCNHAVEDVLGYTAEQSVGAPFDAIFLPETAERDKLALNAVLAGEARLQHETVLLRVDGATVDVVIDLVPLLDGEEVVGISGITRDVTADRRAKAERERASARHAAVAELGRRALQLAEPHALMDEAARIATSVLQVDASVVFELADEGTRLEIVGAAGGDGNEERANLMPLPDDRTTHLGYTLLQGCPVVFSDLETETRFPGSEAMRDYGTRSGIAVPIVVRGRTYGVLAGYSLQVHEFDEGEIAFAESVAHVVGSAVERAQLESADRERALHDSLTKLPNRSLFMDRLRGSVPRARRDESHTAVFMVGVDSFKLVNDEFGHAAGDELLGAIARRLRSEVRASDTVARLGGDEFVILCEGLAGEHDAIALANKLTELWGSPFTLDVGEVFSTASIGVAISENGSEGADSLLRDSDAAMHRAKRRGRGRFELFDEDLRARMHERMRLERDLHRALERDQMRVVYQPIVDLKTGAVAGAEALLRWDHPEWGTVSPMEFIPVAEETGQIIPIGMWVLREACSQVARWQERWPDFRLSVNLSGRQIAESDLPERVSEVLAEVSLTPGTLGLEITESVLMETDGDPEDILASLRSAGARLLLDDFGTGYSSLSYLKRFPLDTLKIDRSFVDGLGREDEDSAIVAAIVQLAQTLDLTVVAEGVETAEQLDLLRDLRCDLAQGYLLSRPIDAPDLEVLLGDAPEPVLRVA
ncbi:MAG: EAL domain-containing protein [Solirubrobacteraceae bacterium]|nr:EAL domain-containing protein [Solirubrobacteraceae bacterium]